MYGQYLNHTDTNQLIRTANCLNGFYEMRVLHVNWLKNKIGWPILFHAKKYSNN